MLSRTATPLPRLLLARQATLARHASRPDQRRRLWMAASSTSHRLGTAVESSAEAIKQALADRSIMPSPDDACFTLVTNHYRARDLENLPKLVKGAIGTDMHIFGTVVDRVPNFRKVLSPFGVSLLYHASGAGDKTSDRPMLRATPFFFGEEDRARLRTTSVGRWHRKQDQQLERPWNSNFESVSKHAFQASLPQELSEIVGSHVFDMLTSNIVVIACAYRDVPLIMLASDNDSSQVLGVLDRCQGNIILELEDTDAVKKLTNFLNRYRSQAESNRKFDELYIQVFGRDVTSFTFQHPATAFYQVASGDPARGGIAVNTTKEFRVGQQVQFYIRNASKEMERVHHVITGSCETGDSVLLSLHTTPHDVEEMLKDSKIAEDLEKELKVDKMTRGKTSPVFGGSSDQGFIYGPPDFDSNEIWPMKEDVDGRTTTSVAGEGSTECSVPQSYLQLCLYNP
ncbi:hypothetical protein EV182_001374 [Spiromyces aspiralis]|uniref:Uncharacterized protein n=1 Tax=Spiromyces aspiralis TaxID=68401 RepID=A0ACC1HJS1_9FUNG|nr:hypothetical protein EV182_001374 [Spiromyces aspiralis]